MNNRERVGKGCDNKERTRKLCFKDTEEGHQRKLLCS